VSPHKIIYGVHPSRGFEKLCGMKIRHNTKLFVLVLTFDRNKRHKSEDRTDGHNHLHIWIWESSPSSTKKSSSYFPVLIIINSFYPCYSCLLQRYTVKIFNSSFYKRIYSCFKNSLENCTLVIWNPNNKNVFTPLIQDVLMSMMSNNFWYSVTTVWWSYF
jgi:hypothetical protein